MSMSSATSTECTVWPLMSMPRIFSALAWASSGSLASFTPPALPRPPILTWALITTPGLPAAMNSAAMARASAGVAATLPCWIGTP